MRLCASRRHPLDQQNTNFLQMVPGLETVAKGIMGPAAEQVLLLENIGKHARLIYHVSVALRDHSA
jgi:hypothetical protein